MYKVSLRLSEERPGEKWIDMDEMNFYCNSISQKQIEALSVKDVGTGGTEYLDPLTDKQ